MTLLEEIAALKQELGIRGNEYQDESDDTEAINSSPLNDNDLVNNIDDYDKSEWVKLRTGYANKLYFLLVGEIIGVFLFAFMIGMEWIKLSEVTLNITIIAVTTHTFALVREIVTNLFKKDK